ncbi:MAG: site-specific recombinase [Clostridiales bacterium]|nr:site-specific recombinase [Clostridiales bacterium]
MDHYCAYLRKSRMDEERNAISTEETLARHKNILCKLAADKQIEIEKFYCEVCSGDSIDSRPQMCSLLRDVENGRWTGVFVVELERLARGDTADQGTIQRIFRITNTTIITPSKEYHPNNEFDNDAFEFGLFLSRREYYAIKRRLIRGRIQAALEGKWPYRSAPYGYKIVRLMHEKGYTLQPEEEKAAIVSLIFEWYTKGYQQAEGKTETLGMQAICNQLNKMQIPNSRDNTWKPSTIASMLENETYLGKVKIGYNQTIETIHRGVIQKKRKKNTIYQIVDGIHPPIIDPITFDAAKRLRSFYKKSPLKKNPTIKNSFAGLLRCPYCGHTLLRRIITKTNKELLICPTKGCRTIGCDFEALESILLLFINQYFHTVKTYPLPCLPAQKNEYLRILLDHIVYEKVNRCQPGEDPSSHIVLSVYPRLPLTNEMTV